MELLTGSNDLGTLGLGLLIAGAAAGLVSGSLGRGAGLILVPALYLVAGEAGVAPDVRFKLAIGTSFAALLPLALATVNLRTWDSEPIKRWATPLLFGVGAGIALNLLAPAIVLVLIFAVAALAAATLTVSVKDETAGAAGRLNAAMAFLHGGLAMALGLGGGSLGVPMMMLTGVPREQATSAAAIFAIPITAIGAGIAVAAGWGAPGLPPHSCGFVNLIAFGIVAPVAFAANRVAAHHADVLDARKLRLLFAAFVVASTAKMLWVAAG